MRSHYNLGIWIDKKGGAIHEILAGGFWESGEIPDEYLEEESLDDMLLKEIETTDAKLASDIEKIEDQEVKQKRTG